MQLVAVMVVVAVVAQPNQPLSFSFSQTEHFIQRCNVICCDYNS
jgi:hypothetical protein